MTNNERNNYFKSLLSSNFLNLDNLYERNKSIILCGPNDDEDGNIDGDKQDEEVVRFEETSDVKCMLDYVQIEDSKCDDKSLKLKLK